MGNAVAATHKQKCLEKLIVRQYLMLIHGLKCYIKLLKVHYNDRKKGSITKRDYPHRQKKCRKPWPLTFHCGRCRRRGMLVRQPRIQESSACSDTCRIEWWVIITLRAVTLHLCSSYALVLDVSHPTLPACPPSVLLFISSAGVRESIHILTGHWCTFTQRKNNVLICTYCTYTCTLPEQIMETTERLAWDKWNR